LPSCTAEFKIWFSRVYQCYYRPPDPKNPSDFWRNDSGLSVFYERARQKKVPQMSAAQSPANSTLFGNEGHSVSRTLSELQGRRPVRINAPGEVLFTLPVEGLDDQRLREFVAQCSANAPELIVTQQRTRAIGIEASTPMSPPLSREVRTSDAADAESGGRFSPKAEAADRATQREVLNLK
jgi:hypothetical protein